MNDHAAAANDNGFSSRASGNTNAYQAQRKYDKGDIAKPKIIPRRTESPSSSHESLENLSSDEVTFIGECAGSSHNTAAILRYCEKRILKPRDVMFSIVGYQPWNRDRSDVRGCVKFFNSLYMCLLFAFIAVGPVLQYDTCFRRDRGEAFEPLEPDAVSGNRTIHCKGSPLFVYIVPSLALIVSWVVTCFLIRLGESEHLKTLLEKVYVQCVYTGWTVVKQRTLSFIWLFWLLVGLLCLMLVLASNILHLVHSRHVFTFFEPRTDIGIASLYVVMVASLWTGDLALVVGLLVYCTQCHLLSMLLLLTYSSLLHGSSSLNSVKKQIDESSLFLHHLNQKLSVGAGLFLGVSGLRAVTGCVELLTLLHHFSPSSDASDETRNFSYIHLAAVSLNFLPWVFLTFLPLYMAAHVTTSYRRLCKVGCQLQVRPFGYQSTPQEEIDSFLLYVSALSLRAKILIIPVHSYVLVAASFITLFLISVLGYILL